VVGGQIVDLHMDHSLCHVTEMIETSAGVFEDIQSWFLVILQHRVSVQYVYATETGNDFWIQIDAENAASESVFVHIGERKENVGLHKVVHL